MVKKEGVWHEVDWQEALAAAANGSVTAPSDERSRIIEDVAVMAARTI